MEVDENAKPPIPAPNRLTPLPSATTLLSLTIIILLAYAFFSGITKQFYASIVFLFYDLFKQMWISVVCLGIFQVLLMIPLRIINLIKSAHINEFKEKTEELKTENEQAYFVKESIRKGNRLILYYTVEFSIQLVSYLSIGRLFLTDFYSLPLESRWLYSFVPYPKYPIQGTFFKIPYPSFPVTKDLGNKTLLLVWLVIIAVQFLIFVLRSVYPRYKGIFEKEIAKLSGIKKFLKHFNSYLVVLFILSFILIKHFPQKIELAIFTGDISIPNKTFNTITAIVTFGTLVWFGANKIERKTKLARLQGIEETVVQKTQEDMFKETVKNAAFVGLGAYFITNHIPSAFELSIFTFELIALISPLTLDKIILRNSFIQKLDGEQSKNADQQS